METFYRWIRETISKGWIISLGAFLLPFFIYLLTLSPSVHAYAPGDRATIYGLDSAELAAAAYSLGIVHAPGYPLYLLLGKTFTYLPFGDVAYRINLMSAFFAAMAILLLYRLALKLTRSRVAAFSTAMLLAFSYNFWTAAVVAEVYTLHALLTLLVLFILLIWQEKRAERYLYTFALLYGLSLGNHTSMGLMAPGLAVFMLATDYRQVLSPRVLLGMALAFAAGLSVYLYLPIRYAADPSFNYVGRYDANGVYHTLDLTTWDGIWWMVSGQQFRPLMFAHRWPEVWQEIQTYGYWLWSNFLAVGIIPGIWGAVKLFSTRRWLSISLLLIYLLNLFFFTTYRVIDTESMYIPTYLIWAIWMSVGCRYILDEVAGWEPLHHEKGERSQQFSGLDRIKRLLYTSYIKRSHLMTAIFLLVPLIVLIVNFSFCDLSNNWEAYRRNSAILNHVEPNAIIFGWPLTASPLRYLQIVEKSRPDVQVINRVFIGWGDMRVLIDREIDHRPVYMMEKEESLTDMFTFIPLETEGFKLERNAE